MVKKRSKSSYYGNTEEMQERQRFNLIPGGVWNKRKIQDIRLTCWWEGASLGDMQFIYEGYVNKRAVEDIPQGEAKSEDYLNNWWNELDLEDKKYIYKVIMKELTKESRSSILKDVESCLKEKLEKER